MRRGRKLDQVDQERDGKKSKCGMDPSGLKRDELGRKTEQFESGICCSGIRPMGQLTERIGFTSFWILDKLKKSKKRTE